MNKVIVVGAGNWGRNLVRNFHSLRALAGVAESNSSLRANIAADYPNIDIYHSFEEALKTETSAIVLATPAPSHYHLALQALQAGKDVFVEKPITLKTEEARELAEYANEHNQILMVGHLLLYQPAIKWMKAYLAAGKAGKVFHVATKRTKLGKVRRAENVWWSFAPHDVSVVLDLLGGPEIKHISSSGHAILQDKIVDNVHVDLSFVTGQTAHIHTSWLFPIAERKTIVIADKQMLVYDEIAQNITIHDKAVDAHLNCHDNGTRVVEVANQEPLKLECQHFLDCLLTRHRPSSDGWNGVAVVEVLEKAQESLNG